MHFNVAAMDSVCWREQYSSLKLLQPFIHLRVLCMYLCMQGRQQVQALHHACKLLLHLLSSKN